MIQKIVERFGGQGGNRVGKALAIVFVALVAFSAVAPFLGGLAVVESDHDGAAAAGSGVPHGDFVYFGEENSGTSGAIHTYDSDGTLNWSNTGYTNVWDATPGPNDEYVYIATQEKIIKFRTSDGVKVWNTSAYANRFNNIRVSPDGTELYAAHNGGNIIAFDTSDGTEKWRYTDPPTLVMGLGISPDGETVYGGDWDSNIHAVNTADGSQKWNVSNPSIGRTLTTTTDGGSVLVGANDGGLYSLAASDGSSQWSKDYFADGIADIQTSPDGTHLLYGRYADANGNGEAGKIDLSTRGIVWNNTYADRVQSHAPAPDESQTYVSTGSGDGNVYGLDWNDGAQIWTDSIGAQVYSADAGSYYAWAGSGGSDGGSTSGGTEQSVGLVEDDLEMFPPSDTELVVNRRTSDYYPLWEVAGYSVEEWRQEAWVEEERSSFNWQNKTSVTLKDGEYYRLELHSPYGTWEDSGFQYDASEYAGSTIWLEPDTGHLDDNGDGTAGGSGSKGTNGPGDGSDDDSGDGSDGEDQGFGPTALSSCTTLDGQDGVEVEYWDPGYETWELEANLSADGEKTYHVYKEFSDARGYYRGCLGDSVTDNSSDDRRDLSWNHTARNETGAIVSSGGLSYDPPVFGPTGNAPDSTGERVGLLAGVLGALGVLWFGGNRYVPASSVRAWPSESINPAFGVGAPIVAVLGLDLAGGGVISASVATGLAQIAPFAGIVGVTVGGYAVLRWIRAPPS